MRRPSWRGWKAPAVERGVRGSGGLALSEHGNGGRASNPRCLSHREAFCMVTQGFTDSTAKWPGLCSSTRSPGAPNVGFSPMNAMTREMGKPDCSSSRREISHLVLKASHAVVT